MRFLFLFVYSHFLEKKHYLVIEDFSRLLSVLIGDDRSLVRQANVRVIAVELDLATKLGNFLSSSNASLKTKSTLLRLVFSQVMTGPSNVKLASESLL